LIDSRSFITEIVDLRPVDDGKCGIGGVDLGSLMRHTIEAYGSSDYFRLLVSNDYSTYIFFASEPFLALQRKVLPWGILAHVCKVT